MLGFLCNAGQETGLSTIISQHCLAPFPGCLLGPFCYAVKALCACDHGDKTYHDDNAAKGSRLCKNRQVCFVLGSQLQSPSYQETKQGFPGTGCQVSYVLPLTHYMVSETSGIYIVGAKSLSALHHIYPCFANAKLVRRSFMFTWRTVAKAYFKRLSALLVEGP